MSYYKQVCILISFSFISSVYTCVSATHMFVVFNSQICFCSINPFVMLSTVSTAPNMGCNWSVANPGCTKAAQYNAC